MWFIKIMGPEWQPTRRKRLTAIIAVLAMGFLVMLLLAPTEWYSGPDRRGSARATMIQLITLAMQMYCEDYDGRFPDAKCWQQGMRQYIKIGFPPKFVGCPPDYAINGNLSRALTRSVAHPETTVVCLESVSGKTIVSSAQEFPMPESGQSRLVGTVDGQCVSVSRAADLRRLKWTVK
jgi:hypothetical protein